MISILLPSRHRPRNIARFIDSFYQNARAGDILNSLEFWFYIDDDDKLSPPELEYQKAEYDGLVNINWIVGKRQNIGNTYNELYTKIDSPDIICVSGDDVVCNTAGWDLVIEDAFKQYKDRLVLVGGYDGFNDSLFTTFFLSKEWIDIVGFVTPYGFDDYSDTTVHSIASMISRIHKVDLYLEHIHPSSGKCEADITMKEKNLRCYGSLKPSHIMYSEQGSLREQIAQRLMDKINERRI